MCRWRGKERKQTRGWKGERSMSKTAGSNDDRISRGIAIKLYA